MTNCYYYPRSFLTKITHHDQRYKSKPAQEKSPKPLNLSFSNICGIHTNFCSVELFLFKKSPDILALCESNLNSSISSSDFSFSGYLPLLRKDSNVHMHGLEFYVHEHHLLATELSLESHLHVSLSVSKLSQLYLLFLPFPFLSRLLHIRWYF